MIYLRLNAEEYAKRLRGYSQHTIELISKCMGLPREEYRKARDITTNSTLDENQVAEKLKELLKSQK